eukprot:scaffold88220_cov54-Phaeocystis_antarctica.AAC.3
MRAAGMASAWIRHRFAHLASSAAERGPTSQALVRSPPPSTIARMRLGPNPFGAALTTLADSALSPSSFHHSGLTTSAHTSSRSMSKAFAVPVCGLHVVARVVERSTEAEVRRGVVRNQGDGLAVGLGCFARVRRVSRSGACALSQQFIVLVTRLRGAAGVALRGLAIPLLAQPTILPPLPLPLLLLVKCRVQLHSARVPRAVEAAPVGRRQLLLAALRAYRMLLPAHF